jgi:hypothetical protein
MESEKRKSNEPHPNKKSKKKKGTIQQLFIKMAKSPFCSFRPFFRELLVFFAELAKTKAQGPQTVCPF